MVPSLFMLARVTARIRSEDNHSSEAQRLEHYDLVLEALCLEHYDLVLDRDTRP